MKITRLLLTVALACFVVVAGAGCAKKADADTDAKPGADAPAAGDPLKGTSWTLSDAAFVQAGVVAPETLVAYPVTIVFADGQLGGTGGVNSYGAPYSVSADGGIEMGDVASTLMAAVDEDANRLESAYFAALAGIAGFEVDAESLVLRDADGAAVLEFVPGD